MKPGPGSGPEQIELGQWLILRVRGMIAQHCKCFQGHYTSLKYRANPNYLRNPKFCVWVFRILFKQNFAATLKTGEKIIFFCDFFLRNPFLRSVLRQKCFLFLRFFLRNPFLRRAWGTLDSGIAVQSYTGIQMLIIWTVGLQSNPTQAYKCGSVELWDSLQHSKEQNGV